MMGGAVGAPEECKRSAAVFWATSHTGSCEKMKTLPITHNFADLSEMPTRFLTYPRVRRISVEMSKSYETN